MLFVVLFISFSLGDVAWEHDISPMENATATLQQIQEAKRIENELLSLHDFWSNMLLKVTHEIWGKGWTENYAKLVFREYCRFMGLVSAFGRVTPSMDVDEVWHGHITDTRRYEKDCIRIFGKKIHHYPYFGIGGEHGTREQLQKRYDLSLSRYVSTFGEIPPVSVWGKMNDSPSCNCSVPSSCGGTGCCGSVPSSCGGTGGCCASLPSSCGGTGCCGSVPSSCGGTGGCCASLPSSCGGSGGCCGSVPSSCGGTGGCCSSA